MKGENRPKKPCFGLKSSFLLPWGNARQAGRWLVGGRSRAVQRLPILSGSVISPRFIARLIKGCRVDACAGYLVSKIASHFQRSNEHFSRSGALAGAVDVAGQQESQMPKLKTKSGAKKRFKVTATGKVMHAQRGKRHGMIKRTKKQIRQLRGTRVLFKTDGDNIKKYFLPHA
jgi:large subunit ribosomal protein L35